MSVYFFDSSAIVKRYTDEVGTAWVVSILEQAAEGTDVYVARITGAEVVSAIVRRGRSGDIFAGDVAKAIQQFRREFISTYHIVEITPALVLKAMELAETYALRGYDAVQLAAALEINTMYLSLGMPTLTLVSADSTLNAAAIAEGLMVEDPNLYP